MPLLVAQGHKLSGNACMVPCFKENGLVRGQCRAKGGGKVEAQESRVHTARQPPSQMTVTLVSQLSANGGPLHLVTASISHFWCQIKVINLEAPFDHKRVNLLVRGRRELR